MRASDSVQKRQRLDSVLHGVLEGGKELVKMTTDSQRWKKIDQIINKPESQLVLLEVPRGVSLSKINTLV